jgi:hypothetical protein
VTLLAPAYMEFTKATDFHTFQVYWNSVPSRVMCSVFNYFLQIVSGQPGQPSQRSDYVTGWMTTEESWFDSQQAQDRVFSPKVQIESRTLPPSTLVGKVARQFDHRPTTDAKLQHACIRKSSPSYAFMAYTGNVTYLEDVSRAVYPSRINSFFDMGAIYCSRIDKGLILINRNLQLVFL